MSRGTLRGRFALSFLAHVMQYVRCPGSDPVPASGSKLIDRKGRMWLVEGRRVRQHDGTCWYAWALAYPATGPLLILDRGCEVEK